MAEQTKFHCSLSLARLHLQSVFTVEMGIGGDNWTFTSLSKMGRRTPIVDSVDVTDVNR